MNITRISTSIDDVINEIREWQTTHDFSMISPPKDPKTLRKIHAELKRQYTKLLRLSLAIHWDRWCYRVLDEYRCVYGNVTFEAQNFVTPYSCKVLIDNREVFHIYDHTAVKLAKRMIRKQKQQSEIRELNDRINLAETNFGEISVKVR